MKTNDKLSKKIDFISKVIGWFQIFFSISIIGIIVALAINYFVLGVIGKILAIICCIFGIIVGVIFACQLWKKKEIIKLVTRINSSPDLD